VFNVACTILCIKIKNWVCEIVKNPILISYSKYSHFGENRQNNKKKKIIYISAHDAQSFSVFTARMCLNIFLYN